MQIYNLFLFQPIIKINIFIFLNYNIIVIYRLYIGSNHNIYHLPKPSLLFSILKLDISLITNPDQLMHSRNRAYSKQPLSGPEIDRFVIDNKERGLH